MHVFDSGIGFEVPHSLVEMFCGDRRWKIFRSHRFHQGENVTVTGAPKAGPELTGEYGYHERWKAQRGAAWTCGQLWYGLICLMGLPEPPDLAPGVAQSVMEGTGEADHKELLQRLFAFSQAGIKCPRGNTPAVSLLGRPPQEL